MIVGPKKYANGGEVRKSAQRPPKAAPKTPRTGDTVQSPKPDSTADTLRNQRARQMKALGLRNGGKVKKKR